ncbi:hypothetical protein VE00_07720 [Pseudogymnoascus sp. WSF 3629]|nr:hypothetical protein VE00_07720 [Pseudogymnoascus sp. WSF 3629]
MSQARWPVARVRWRILILTLVTLTVVNFVFFDNALRNAHSTQLFQQSITNPQTRIELVDWEVVTDPLMLLDEYLAICAAVKDQYADLTEWLALQYHHHNIWPFPGHHPRYYHPTMHSCYMQVSIQNGCLKLFGHKHKWIAFMMLIGEHRNPGRDLTRVIHTAMPMVIASYLLANS